MELIQHSEYIYSTTYETKRDRPSLGYIKGSNFSVMVDAGTSSSTCKGSLCPLKRTSAAAPHLHDSYPLALGSYFWYACRPRSYDRSYAD